MNRPAILYKYLDPDRVDILQNRLIRFTQPDGFNDPFDSRPCYDSVVERTLIEEVCQLEDPAETKKWQAELTKLFKGDEVKDWYTSGSLNKIGILCLAERPDNILMWAHYARSHQGFVVGFDTAHQFLKNSQNGPEILWRRVSYTIDRPKRETLTDLTAEEAFHSKSADWAYEGEWRVFDAASEAVESRTLPSGEAIHLFGFAPEAVREVIVGARIGESAMKAIVTALTHPDYQHVRLIRAELHADRYCLNLRDIDLPE